MEDFAYAPISVHRVINRPTRDPCSRCGGAVSDRWSSKLVVNKSVHKHRAEISSISLQVRVSANFRAFGVFILDTWKIRYLYETRDEGRGRKGGRKKKKRREGIDFYCPRTNFLPFPPTFIKFSLSSFLASLIRHVEQWFDDTNPSSNRVFRHD